MAIELSSDRIVCFKCGLAYSRRKGYFSVSYAIQHKGVGYLPICKDCVDNMYNQYLARCDNNSESAVRQMCRKLDIYWSKKLYEAVKIKTTSRSMMTQYLAKLANGAKTVGKCYDDTLSEEGTLWEFAGFTEEPEQPAETEPAISEEELLKDIPDEVIAFWGTGYTADMYTQLEQRRSYWMSKFPGDFDLDIGTEAIIRQICSLELDINRDRAAGKPIEKSVTALNTLLGSMNLKPVQKRQEELDAGINNTPMGVWLYKYEQKRPLPDIDDSLKDVNGIKKYVFTWMGHLCKMLGIKNSYSKLYEDEIERYKVDKPEYEGDDEDLLEDFFSSNQEEDDE